MHLHQRVQEAAKCNGISGAVWMTETARERVRATKDSTPPHEGPAPDWDCSCFAAGTRVLTGDFRWTSIEMLKPGDSIIGFNAEPLTEPHHAKRRVQTTYVTKTFSRRAAVMRLKVAGREITVTPDHKVLIRLPQAHNHVWREVQDLVPGDEIIAPFTPWEPATGYDAGWLSGIYDGEGCVDSMGGVRLTTGRLTIAQKQGVVLNRILGTLASQGFDYRTYTREEDGLTNVRISGGLDAFFRFAGSIRPVRLLNRLAQGAEFGALEQSKATWPAAKGVYVESVVPAGEELVYNLQTESGAYFAEGLAVSNCGSYFFRLLKDCWTSPTSVYAHVTCMERTMLHQNGGRTTQYSVDYLLASTVRDGQSAYIFHSNDKLAQGPMVPLIWGYVGAGGALAEEINYGEALTQVAKHLDVPVLSKSDLAGCPSCLVANGWVEPEVITEEMRKSWYGAGYVERERQHDRDMGEAI